MAISNIKITYYEANNACSNKTNESARAQAEAEEWKTDWEVNDAVGKSHHNH